MSKLILDVSVLGGADIDVAIQEAKDLAIKLDLAYVKFKFNNHTLSISQRCFVQIAVNEYYQGQSHIVY